VLLSLALTAATFFPGMSTQTLEVGFGVGVLVGVLGGAGMLIAWQRGRRKATERTAAELGGLDPDQVEELDATPLTRAERKAIREADRDIWRTPALDTLERPAFSTGRMVGMLALRGYLLIAVILVGVKIFQSITG